jgi:O-antigen/teichoic acid export membrane protein
MVRLNIVKSLWLAARMLGGVLLLFQSPDIVHLLLWYVATSVAELAMVAILAFRAFPELRLLPTYDAGALRRSFSFTASMSFITLLAVLLTQLDRLVIANVLGLEDMGRYAVAYNLALGLSLIQTAVNSAALPVYASAHSLGDVSRLAQSYATTSQLMGFLLSAPAIALVAYGHEILTLWVGAQMAAIAYPVLAVLTTGFWLNGAYSNSFIMGVAQGRPGMFVRINLIGLVFYALLLLAGVSLGNIVAVAAAWAGLNLFYVGYALRKAHGALELGLAGPWFMRSFGMFALAGAASFTAGRGITWLVGGHAGAVLGFASGCAIYCLLSYRLMLPELRDDLLSALSPTPRGTAK